MTKPNSTEIIFVVDRSGSMSPIAADMRGGFDTFLTEQRKLPGECKVTLTQFDDHYDIVYSGRPIAEVPSLELLPRGSTALHDAIGRTIDATGARLAALKESDRPSQVLFVIITDGGENASREYDGARIEAMISKQRKEFSWEFIFMGANQDAVATAKGLGIQASNAVNFRARKGAEAMGVMRGLSANVDSYRSGKGIGNVQEAYEIASAMPAIAPVLKGDKDA